MSKHLFSGFLGLAAMFGMLFCTLVIWASGVGVVLLILLQEMFPQEIPYGAAAFGILGTLGFLGLFQCLHLVKSLFCGSEGRGFKSV